MLTAPRAVDVPEGLPDQVLHLPVVLFSLRANDKVVFLQIITSQSVLMHIVPVSVLAPVDRPLPHVEDHGDHRGADLLGHGTQNREAVLHVEVLRRVTEHVLRRVSQPIHGWISASCLKGEKLVRILYAGFS